MPRLKPSPARARMLQLPRDQALEREIAAVVRRQEAFIREISAVLRARGIPAAAADQFIATGMLGNTVFH